MNYQRVAPGVFLLFLSVVFFVQAGICSGGTIELDGNRAVLKAGKLVRTIQGRNGNLITREFRLDETNLLSEPTGALSFRIQEAKPNKRPEGIEHGDTGHDWDDVNFTADLLKGGTDPTAEKQEVKWVNEQVLRSSNWSDQFNRFDWEVQQPSTGVKRLVVTAQSTEGVVEGLTCRIVYEIYRNHSAIRKWISLTNDSNQWRKVDRLKLEDIELADPYSHRTKLTPSTGPVDSSVVAVGRENGSIGVIAGNEIPSALRSMHSDGSMGYRKELFEWVLGPGETFTSEPVFYYGYNGEVRDTLSSKSTPLARTVEGPYRQFLREHVGLASSGKPVYAPQWNSWANFRSEVNKEAIREQARIAARCGFRQFTIDLGWQKYAGTEVDSEKFPEFKRTTTYIRSQGLKLGLWVSCLRRTSAKDFNELNEDYRAVPLRVKGNIGYNSYGMSFTSPWREYYLKDLMRLHQQYGADYFKQDFSNIKFGDIAKGHRSRTRKESLLRGLRALLTGQDVLLQETSGMHPQLTHEIYWGTPGPPADLAVLKHAVQYHIPPNDYSGVGPKSKEYDSDWSVSPEKLRNQLIQGAWNARRHLFAHRGLLLRGLEYFAAPTVNHKGSLTRKMQDREVASWLMGAPMVFSGDLSSLTEENIKHYRRRFTLLKRLQDQYGIYHHFQYSGVPEPTNKKWHWWGKLNSKGYGAVVIVRGSGGQNTRRINIPWVSPRRKYRVLAQFSGENLGVFTGKQLKNGAIERSLSPHDQELLELAPVSDNE